MTMIVMMKMTAKIKAMTATQAESLHELSHKGKNKAGYTAQDAPSVRIFYL